MKITEHPLYNTWYSALSRCANKDYEAYGGRGIKVCDRWRLGEDGKHGFLCFLEDMGPKPTAKHTIDRKNNDGDYEPSNCRWATRPEQALNYRRNHLVTFDGRTMPLKQWCDLLGVPNNIVAQRMRRDGMSFVEACTTSKTEAKRLAAVKMWAKRRGLTEAK